MLQARLFQVGVKAYLSGKALGDNPYDCTTSAGAHEAWKAGWFEARQERWCAHHVDGARMARLFWRAARPGPQHDHLVHVGTAASASARGAGLI